MVGCGGGTGQPYLTSERAENGLTIVLPGIHGRLWLSESISEGLAAGGEKGAIEIYDWTWHGKYFPFYNLGAVERNHEQARLIAKRVMEYQKAHPGKPVTLVGYSGGAPLAIWTAECLPPESKLDGIVLLATPLVPQYDLRPALRASRKGIVSFYSPRDRVYLAMGTLIFGTMDKQHVVSAGNVKFVPPPNWKSFQGGAPVPVGSAVASGPARDQPPEYDQLFQVSWRPSMSKLGYDGSHLTIGAKDFIAQWVAPLVRARSWDQAMIEAPDKPASK